MATNAVLRYLQDTNRPYSANDVMVNLHNEYGKTAVQKSLDQLTEAGKIREKTYGKQKVYTVIQPDEEADQGSELKELEEKVVKTSENLHLVEKELKSSEAELQELKAALTTEQAKDREEQLRRTVETLKSKLKDLTKNVIRVSPEERDKLKKEREKCVKEYRKRKRMCVDMVDAILEGYQVPKKSLLEEIGVETDEDVNMVPFN